MYKKTQEQSDHLNRVGSAATRESARGIIRNIPAWARIPEEYFNSLLESYDIANKRLFQMRSRASYLKFRCDTSQASQGEKLELGDIAPLLEQFELELDQLRHAATAAARNSWANVFYFQAKELLDPDLFQSIDEKSKQILQRQRSPSLPRFKGTKEEQRKAQSQRWP